MAIYSNFEGTKKEEITIGLKNADIGFRSNSGVAEYRDFGGSWIPFADLSGAFEVASDVIREKSSEGYDNDFVVGSPQLADDGNAAHDSRMLFDKGLSAFRVGKADGTEWDTLGQYSAALGWNCQAPGYASFAGGLNVDTINSYGFSYGSGIVNNGQYTACFGTGHTSISGARGLISGSSNEYIPSTGNGAAIGDTCKVSEDYAFALGRILTAQHRGSFVTGLQAVSTMVYGRAHSSGKFSIDGDCQKESVHVLGDTTGTSATTIYPSRSSSYGITCPNDKTVYAYTARITGVVQAAAGTPAIGEVIDIKIEGVFKRQTTMTPLAQIKTVIFRDTNLTSCNAEVYASSTNSIAIRVYGETSTTIRWSGHIDFSEIRY